jgi:hypothetical protein
MLDAIEFVGDTKRCNTKVKQALCSCSLTPPLLFVLACVCEKYYV